MSRRRLHCPHCRREFDYDLVPGMSVTAVRLGGTRYIRCPLCHRFATFPLPRLEEERAERAHAPPPSSEALEGTAALPARGSVPRFSDRRTFVRWIGVLLAPAVVLALLAGFVPVSFGTEIFVLGASAGLTGIAAVLMIAYLRPERVR